MENSSRNRVAQMIFDICQILLDLWAILLGVTGADPLRAMLVILASQSITILENDRPRMRFAEGLVKFLAGVGLLFIELQALFFIGLVADVLLNGGQISLGFFKGVAFTADMLGGGLKRMAGTPVYVERFYKWLDTPAAVVAEQPPVLSQENLRKMTGTVISGLSNSATSAVQGIGRRRVSPDLTVVPKPDEVKLEDRRVSNS